jgi:hypothetical protein
MKCSDALKVRDKAVTEYECLRCGNYSITHEASSNIEGARMSNPDRAKVAAYLRERTLRGDSRIRILSQQYSDREFDTPVVTFDEIIKERFPRTVSERLDRALKNIHRLSDVQVKTSSDRQ